jgi:N-acetylglucosamine kinase-like BadF-type ATPase
MRCRRTTALEGDGHSETMRGCCQQDGCIYVAVTGSCCRGGVARTERRHGKVCLAITDEARGILCAVLDDERVGTGCCFASILRGPIR